MRHRRNEIRLHARHGQIAPDGARDKVSARDEEQNHDTGSEHQKTLPDQHAGFRGTPRAGEVERPRKLRLRRSSDCGAPGGVFMPCCIFVHSHIFVHSYDPALGVERGPMHILTGKDLREDSFGPRDEYGFSARNAPPDQEITAAPRTSV